MKKAIALLLCLLMMTSLVACGSNNTATDDSQTSQVETENNKTSTPEESKTPTESEDPTEEPEPVVNVGWEVDYNGEVVIIPIPAPPVTQNSFQGKKEREAGECKYYVYTIAWIGKDEVKTILTADALKAYINDVMAVGYDQITTEFVLDENTEFEFEATKVDGISCVSIEGNLNNGDFVVTVDVPMNAQ